MRVDRDLPESEEHTEGDLQGQPSQPERGSQRFWRGFQEGILWAGLRLLPAIILTGVVLTFIAPAVAEQFIRPPTLISVSGTILAVGVAKGLMRVVFPRD